MSFFLSGSFLFFGIFLLFLFIFSSSLSISYFFLSWYLITLPDSCKTSGSFSPIKNKCMLKRVVVNDSYNRMREFLTEKERKILKNCTSLVMDFSPLKIFEVTSYLTLKFISVNRYNLILFLSFFSLSLWQWEWERERVNLFDISLVLFARNFD